jgi:hypothetical protein
MKNLIVYFQIVIAAVCFTSCAKDKTYEYYKISGTVIDVNTENPIAGAKVYLIKFSADNSIKLVDESNGEITSTIDSTETGVDGSFSFSKQGSSIDVVKSGYNSSNYIENAALFPVKNDGKVTIALKPL